jgi:hypothetical protein
VTNVLLSNDKPPNLLQMSRTRISVLLYVEVGAPEIPFLNRNLHEDFLKFPVFENNDQ